MILIVVSVVVACAAGALLYIMRPRSTRAATMTSVMRQAQGAEATLLSSLGPNSTLHLVVRSYTAPTGVAASSTDTLPSDTTLEEWITFDGDGKLLYDSSTIRGTTDGKIYSVSDYVDGHLVQTDALTGVRMTSKAYTLTPDKVRATYANNVQEELGVTPSNAAAPLRVWRGRSVYVVSATHPDGDIESAFIDAATFRQVHSQTTNAAGVVVDSADTVVFEVLTPAVTPTPSQAVATPAASATATSSATPTGVSPSPVP